MRKKRRKANSIHLRTDRGIAHFGHSSLREILEQARLANRRVADQNQSVLK